MTVTVMVSVCAGCVTTPPSVKVLTETGRVKVEAGSVTVTVAPGSVMVESGSVSVTPGSVMVSVMPVMVTVEPDAVMVTLPSVTVTVRFLNSNNETDIDSVSVTVLSTVDVETAVIVAVTFMYPVG